MREDDAEKYFEQRKQLLLSNLFQNINQKNDKNNKNDEAKEKPLEFIVYNQKKKAAGTSIKSSRQPRDKRFEQLKQMHQKEKNNLRHSDNTHSCLKESPQLNNHSQIKNINNNQYIYLNINNNNNKNNLNKEIKIIQANQTKKKKRMEINLENPCNNTNKNYISSFNNNPLKNNYTEHYHYEQNSSSIIKDDSKQNNKQFHKS